LLSRWLNQIDKIIDAKEIITGSFNFTNAAEHYNSENLLILKNDPALLLKYLQNYQQRHHATLT
jgi:phosphatidylserine/phosphatidylglycerophosphate/cardiolipin synthase-like enzyme